MPDFICDLSVISGICQPKFKFCFTQITSVLCLILSVVYPWYPVHVCEKFSLWNLHPNFVRIKFKDLFQTHHHIRFMSNFFYGLFVISDVSWMLKIAPSNLHLGFASLNFKISFHIDHICFMLDFICALSAITSSCMWKMSTILSSVLPPSLHLCHPICWILKLPESWNL